MMNYEICQDISDWHTYSEQLRQCQKEIKSLDVQKDELWQQYSTIADPESEDEVSPSFKINSNIQDEKLILEQQLQNVTQSKSLIQNNISNMKNQRIQKNNQDIHSSEESEESNQSFDSDESDFYEFDQLFSEDSLDNDNQDTYQITQQEKNTGKKIQQQLDLETEQQSKNLKWKKIYRNINSRYEKIQKDKVLSQQDIDDIIQFLDRFRQNKMLQWLETEFNQLEHQIIYQLDKINQKFDETESQILFRIRKLKLENKINKLEKQYQGLRKNQIYLQQKISQLNPTTIKLLKSAIIDQFIKEIFDS